MPKVVYHRLLILQARERRLKFPVPLLPRNWRRGQPRRQPLCPSNSRYYDLHSPSSLLVHPMSLVLSRARRRPFGRPEEEIVTMTCQCDCTHVGLANRRCFIAGLACTAILPMAANAQLAGPPTVEDMTFMRMAIEEARLADFPFGAVIVRDGAVMARGRNQGRTEPATRPRTARWTRSASASRSTAARPCAAARSTRRANRARCAWAPSSGAMSAAGVCRVGDSSSRPRSIRSCCRAPRSRPRHHSRRSRSPVACWQTRRWSCSEVSQRTSCGRHTAPPKVRWSAAVALVREPCHFRREADINWQASIISGRSVSRGSASDRRVRRARPHDI